MSEAAVRVIGLWPSPFVIRVLIALKHKGVNHELVEEELGKKSELLLRSNPVYKKIPVLLHHGKPICESQIIIQYIDEVWSSDAPSTAFLPADPYTRAVQRFWAQYVDDKFPSAIRIVKGTDDGDKDEAAGQLSTALQLLEEAFAKLSQGKSYFGGDSMGLLDMVLGSYLGWLKAVEQVAGVKFLDESKLPELTVWADRFCAHHSVRDVMPETDRLVQFNAYVNGVSKDKDSHK